MRKHVVTSFLIFVLLVSMVFSGVQAHAASISSRDLSALGVYAVQAGRAKSAPSVDGVVSAGEYPYLRTVSAGDGLHLANEITGEELTDHVKEHFSFDFNSTRLSYGVTFDDAKAYCFMRVFAVDTVLTEAYHAGFGNAVAAVFSLGLAQDEDLVLYTSAWENTAFIRNGSCVAVTGQIGRAGSYFERYYCSWRPVNTPGFTDGDGFLWNGNGYKQYTGVTQRERDGGRELTVECAIPLAELLLTVPADQREAVAKALKDGTGPVYGCFSAGIILPGGGNLDTAILGTYRGSRDLDAGGNQPPLLPAPLYWTSTPPAASVTLPKAAPEGESGSDPAPQPGAESAPVATESGASFGLLPFSDPGAADGAEETDGDGALDDGDLEGLVPSDEGSEQVKYGETKSELSPWLGLISSIFLTVGTIFVFLTIRAMDKRDQHIREAEEKKVADRRSKRKEQEGLQRDRSRSRPRRRR